ncbi:collagen-like protein [Streptomyces albireticuli]|uniref:Uncharacterized protein n=1 Tax=Streptomyces albireticuli TaxID=1940 RepID=A0A2A2D3U9_9ACTN|nr:collagen-like protein [Streptomyces albireticuli]MCD9196061.1 collagen-like protein [Streptomyces albireticuli]PAU46185.1 hypothetical protein CK936_25660 [Streptomyces albireticuli]
MPLPPGLQTVTVTGSYQHPNGSPFTGRVIFTPEPAVLTSAAEDTIVLGPVEAQPDATGAISVTLLATDAAGVTPTGWTYRVTERWYDAPGRSYPISLPAAAPTVDLADIAPTAPAEGEYVVVTGPAGPTGPQGPAGPQGPQGSPGSEAEAQAYTDAAVATHAADTTAVHGITDTALLETQAGATAKVAAHTAASDPHGDRAYADSSKLSKAANLSDLGSVNTARTNLGLGNSATLNVGTTAGTVAAGDDARLSDARTPTAHASTHAAVGSDPVTLTQAQVTGLVSALAALLPLAGGTISGNLTVSGYTTLQGGQFNSDFAAFGDLRLIGSGKAYRLRRGGSSLDFEGGGADVIISVWSADTFTGTQRSYFRLSADAQNIQIAGKAEYVDGLYGTTRHVLDGSTNTLGFHGASPVTQQAVTGSRLSGAALASLLTALDTLGLIDDQTTA